MEKHIMNSLKRRFISLLLVAFLSISLVSNLVLADRAFAASDNNIINPNVDSSKSKKALLATVFSVQESDIQTQLDNGYTAAEIEQSLKERKNKNDDWTKKLKSKVQPINLSKDHKTKIVNNLQSNKISTSSSTNQASTMTIMSAALTAGDPTDVNTKPDEAPYSIRLDNEILSTLSGGLSISATDLTLPGRNGLGFALTRTYNTSSAQFYKMDIDMYGNNITKPTDDETKFPIGKGWTWDISSVEIDTAANKKYLHLSGSGTYEWDGTNLKGYPWKDITLSTDAGTTTVNGETSAYVLTSLQGIKQYFNNAGLLLKISDPYNNTVQFSYSIQGSYGKVLTTVQDAIGNTITIAYTSDKVILTKGNQVVTYYKTLLNGKELLTQVIDPIGRATWYDYSLQSAQFNLMGTTPNTDNPYAILTDIIYPTGAKTVYTYDSNPITRFVGSNSVNQTYRVSSREDRIYYTDGSYLANNQKGITYIGDMGSSYNQTIPSFTTTIDDGLKTTVFTNQKDCSDTTIPPTFYNTNVAVADKVGVEVRSTTYSFDTARHWYWPIGTSSVTSVTNNGTTTTGQTVSTSRSFDDYGNVTLQVDPMGSRTSYVYDPTTHLDVSTSQQMSSTQTSYTEYQRNTQGTIIQISVKDTDTNGTLRSQTKYGIDPTNGNATSITFCDTTICNTSSDIVKAIEYSSTYGAAFPTKTTLNAHDVDGNATAVMKQYTFDISSGKLLTATDAMNYVTTYQYDSIGRVTNATHNVDGTFVSLQYDDSNNMLTAQDETGITTVSKWNPLGWKIEDGIVNSSGYKAKDKNGYDIYGKLLWSEDAVGNRTSMQYDAWNRQKAVISPDMFQSNLVYDDINLTQITIDPESYSIKTIMDKLGRVLQKDEIKNTGVTTTLSTVSYDFVGNVLTSKDAKNNISTYQFDVISRLTNVINPKLETTGYTYDLLGNLITTTLPDTKTTSKQYDELGRVIKTTDANLRIEKSYYNANGSMTSLVDRNGTVFNYQYTNRNLLWKKIAPDETIIFGYDNAGRRTSMNDVTGTTGYSYDNYTGQLRTLTFPDGRTLQYDYDSNGNRQQMTDPFGSNIYYDYDSRNRLKSVGQAIGDADASYEYYKNNLMKTISQKNGISSNYTYDGLQLDTLIDKKSDNTIINSYHYNYDNNKNITQIVIPNGTSNFTYDALNRISTTDQGNQTYQYDNRGNRSSLKSNNPLESPATAYGYDKRDQMTNATTNSGVVSYKYNGDGLLWERTENGQITRYYNDGTNVIAEAAVSGGIATLKARYERGNSLVARQGTDNEKQFYLQNGHGDITELRDSSGNTQLNKYTYDLWGNPLTTSETVENPFLYSGEYWDKSTSLQYLRARWYDPSVGRFINEDTYEGDTTNPLSLNLYTYVENNPLTNSDPTGHYCESTVDGVFYSHSGDCKGTKNGDVQTNVHHVDDDIYNESKSAGNSNSGKTVVQLEQEATEEKAYQQQKQEATQKKVDDLYNNTPRQNKVEALETMLSMGFMPRNAEAYQILRADLQDSDLSTWNKGSFDNEEGSLIQHFIKHGGDVDAKSPSQYLRKAQEFARTRKGSTSSPVDGAVEGVIRYRKNGKYVDIAPDGTIVSFGK